MSAAAPSAPLTDLTAERERRARRRVFVRAMREGACVASNTLRDAEPWTRACALQDALAHARRLTGAHLHLLFAALARGNRPFGYVTAEYAESAPPALADWSRWMGGVAKQSVHLAREELHAWRILTYVAGDPMRVAVNPVWETWDPQVFEPHDARPGAGRKARHSGQSGQSGDVRTRQDRDPDDGASGVNLRIDDASIAGYTARQSPDIPASIPRLTDREAEERQDTASPGLPTLLPGVHHHTKSDTDVSLPDTLDTPPRANVMPDVDDQPPTRCVAPAAPRGHSPNHQYRIDLLAAIEQVNGVKAPNHGREWAAAGRFYRHPAGVAPIELVAACYAQERQRPRWDCEYLSLTHLLSHYDAYTRSPERYARGIKRARDAADGVFELPASSMTPVRPTEGHIMTRSSKRRTAARPH